jgi:hypothetical protein
MEELPMRKKPEKQKSKSPDSLLRTSKKDIELTEQELRKVSGGKLVGVKTISWSHDDEAP